jgi:phenylacetate-CoA ligase
MSNLLTKLFWNSYLVLNTRRDARIPVRSREQLLAIQNKRLRKQILHAYHTVPHYREVMDRIGLSPRDVRSIADLSALPLIDSKQLARDPARFFSSRYTQPDLILHTSGSTGYRKTVHYDNHALMHALLSGHRQRRVLATLVGTTFGYKELIIEPPGLTGTRLRHYFEQHSLIPKKLDFQRHYLTPSCTTFEFVDVLRSFEPHVVRGYGAHLGALFRELAIQNIPFPHPLLIIYGADSMSKADRWSIENRLDIPVWSSYQAVEALRIGFQCERRDGFHVNIDQIGLSIVDENGNAVPPGQPGRVIVSNLINRATVLLNYDIGDLACQHPDPCPCGRTLPLLSDIRGRTSDIISLPDGRRIHPFVLIDVIDSVSGVLQRQIHLDGTHHMTVHIVCHPGENNHTIEQQVRKTVQSFLGPAIGVDIKTIESIIPDASGKIKLVKQ